MKINPNKQYKTKAGLPVLIHEHSGKGSFPIKGSVFKKHKGRHNNPRYEVWQKSGMCGVIDPSGDDLVEISNAELNDLFEKK